MLEYILQVHEYIVSICSVVLVLVIQFLFLQEIFLSAKSVAEPALTCANLKSYTILVCEYLTY